MVIVMLSFSPKYDLQENSRFKISLKMNQDKRDYVKNRWDIL